MITSIFMLTSGHSPHVKSGKATTRKRIFSRTTSISIDIKADPSIIWALLTNARDFARWNSTIISLEGEIKKGEKIRLKSTLDPDRIFRLKVIEMIAGEKLVWGDMLGKRVFTLKYNGRVTTFTMREKIGGLFFPLFAGKIPSFEPAFERFASDLKHEAEKITQFK